VQVVVAPAPGSYALAVDEAASRGGKKPADLKTVVAGVDGVPAMFTTSLSGAAATPADSLAV
jgi:hypothetical protein